jgi:hypothetical protein
LAQDEPHEYCESEEEADGLLAHSCASIVMKIMFGARCSRPDILKTVSQLSTRLSKWRRRDDLALRRLVSYISSTYGTKLVSYIGDDFRDLKIACYIDSDFASDASNLKSTSGHWLELLDPRTKSVISFGSSRQTAVAKSSTEAEVAAGDRAIRKELLPISDLVDVLRRSEPALLTSPPPYHRNTVHTKALVVSPLDLLQPTPPESRVPLHVYEDNQACRLIMQGTASKEPRHTARTHRISISFLQSIIRACQVNIHYVKTDENLADVFTKMIPENCKWQNALKLMRMETKPS